VRTLLCQPGKSLNIREAIDEGKILLFNLSDGIIGERASQLLGQLIVSKFQLAVFSRADTGKSARRPFYLYLDEFQTFVGVNAESYQRLLSRSRKYVFGLVLAHQQTHQITPDLLHAILGNVTTLISFSVSHDDAGKLSREYAVATDDGLHHIPPEEFLQLQRGEAIVKIDKNVFPLHTYLADKKPDYIRAKEVIERSRLNYGMGDGAGNDDKPDKPDDDVRPDDDDDDIDPSRIF
jgi:hypothetical protein